MGLSMRVSPVYAMIEAIVGGKHNDRSDADGQREETLDYGLLPDSGIKQLSPLGLQKEDDAIDSTIQGNCLTEQGKEYDIWEKCQEICRLARALNSPHDDQEDDKPRGKQGDSQLPVRQPDALRYVQCLLDDHVPASINIITRISSGHYAIGTYRK